MRKWLKTVILSSVVLLLLGGCAAPQQQSKDLKYPRKPINNPERKSGPEMMFYEAAEEDADLNGVIITPPGKKEEKRVKEVQSSFD